VALERDSNYKSLSKLKITAIMSFKVKDFCLKISLLICFLQLFQGGYAQYDFSSVDNFLKANQKALGNSLVVMVYKDGKVVYKKEMGDFDAKTQAPIASCSKWLTAALVMTFVDEGKMSLDDAVEQIKIATRQLARRQMKWFKRFGDVHWMPGDLPLGEKVERAMAVWGVRV